MHENSSNALFASISLFTHVQNRFKDKWSINICEQALESVTRLTFITKIDHVLCTAHKLSQFIEFIQQSHARKIAHSLKSG